jgi:hypothetical protein
LVEPKFGLLSNRVPGCGGCGAHAETQNSTMAGSTGNFRTIAN